MKKLLLVLALGLTTLLTVTDAMGQTNVALGKSTKQSTDAFPTGLASSAVDGNTDGNFFNGSVTHTTSMNNPWWTVDLGADHRIDEIRIWNRTDCCAERLNNISVTVFGANGENVSRITVRDREVPDVARRIEVQIANREGTTVLTSPSVSTPITIPLNITGRYVTVAIDQENAILSLAEVEVFGSSLGQPAPVQTRVPVVNLARGAQVSQSSTFSEGYAERAVDGNTDGNWSNGSVTHTGEEYNSFLVIDLGKIRVIKSIKIYNRTDCCMERLGKFFIYYSQTPIADLGQLYAYGGYDIQGDARPFIFEKLVLARYVKIMLSGTGYLSLAEVEIMGN